VKFLKKKNTGNSEYEGVMFRMDIYYSAAGFLSPLKNMVDEIRDSYSSAIVDRNSDWWK
jgi:hypothetical protein